MPGMTYQEYDQARIKLCNRLKYDIASLELIAKMDKFVHELAEDYENLDPRGEK